MRNLSSSTCVRYKARVTKYNVAGAQSVAKGLEGTHTLVYEDDSVVNTCVGGDALFSSVRLGPNNR